MAGKSRRGRGRHLPRSKRKGRKVSPAPAAQAYEPAPEAERPVPSAKTPRATVAATKATNISAELRRIGILAGIILVILVVLALIFA